MKNASGADELGAHVSSAGGVDRAPERAAALDAGVLQLFTKQPSRWAEREVDDDLRGAFLAARERHEIRLAVSHDSYLINLASPDAKIFDRSFASFCSELRRCNRLGIEYVVTHPGNATGGEPQAALERNAEAIQRALIQEGGTVEVLVETTAGSGTALGSSFEELAALREMIDESLRARVGVCIDTCHVWAAGYDIAADYDGVIRQLDRVLGLDCVRLFHLNDSQRPFGSRKDRHAGIGEGTIGEEPFRRLMTDPRLAGIPKVIETPKGDDHTANDRRNLGRLRGYRSEGAETKDSERVKIARSGVAGDKPK